MTTLYAALAVLPTLSTAVQVTAVVPIAKTLLVLWSQPTVTPWALSVAVGSGSATVALALPGSLFAAWFAGAVTCGGCVSLTVIVRLALTAGDVLAVQVTM